MIEPHDDWFSHPSQIHGASHTRRVLILLERVLEVVRTCEPVAERVADLARLAAAVHDTERTHDGVCRIHGAHASERRRGWVERELNGGALGDYDWSVIAFAVRQHCLDGPFPAGSPDQWQVAKLLKAADSLDRVRLARWGDDPAREVDPKYFAWAELAALIPEAGALFQAI